MKANKTNILLCSSFVIYCVWIVISAMNHEPNMEEYHVWRMVHDRGFSELWSAMSSEGHFILWYLLQWPFVKWIGMDYHCLYIVSVSLMIVAAWLLLFQLKFNTLGKILILFSAPFCYYFPVVSRCYALIPPILIGLAVLYQKRSHPFLYCLLLGLLANTHAYIEGLVAILWCLFVYNQIILLYKTNPQQAKINLYASIITIFFVLIAFWQVVGGLMYVINGIDPPFSPLGEGKNTPEVWFSFLHDGYRIKFFHTLHEKFNVIPELDVLATITAWICVIVGTYESVKRSEQSWIQLTLILFFGIAWQIFFACNIYGVKFHRVYLIYYTIIFVICISYNLSITQWVNIALIALWFLTTSSQYVMIKDLYQIQHSDIYTASKYDNLITKDAPLYVPMIFGLHEMMSRPFRLTELSDEDRKMADDKISEWVNETGDCYLFFYGTIDYSHDKWQVDTLIQEYGGGLYYIKEHEDIVAK